MDAKYNLILILFEMINFVVISIKDVVSHVIYGMNLFVVHS